MKVISTEQELIESIAARDPAGAAALYDEYAAKLFRIICCSVNDRQAAEAVLEETLQFIWNNCSDRPQQDKPLLLWMAGVARQIARKNAAGLRG